MVVQSECSTSGGMGGATHTINGVSVDFARLFMSVSTSELTATSCPGDTYSRSWSCPLYSSQITMLHEMVHGLGFGQHSKAYQCLAEPTDTLKCGFAEYGDLFDIMGKGSYLLGLSARHRYYLGWFGSDEVLGISSAGTYTIRALGVPTDGADTGGTAVKRAAFVRTPGGSGEADGVWVEFVGGGSQWGLSEDGVTDVKALNSAGLFLRKEGTLIDAKRQLCGDAVYADAWEWQEEELNEVTLTAGRAFLDQATGIELSGVSIAADGGSVSFDVAYRPVDNACRRDYPRIGEGLSASTCC